MKWGLGGYPWLKRENKSSLRKWHFIWDVKEEKKPEISKTLQPEDSMYTSALDGKEKLGGKKPPAAGADKKTNAWFWVRWKEVAARSQM